MHGNAHPFLHKLMLFGPNGRPDATTNNVPISLCRIGGGRKAVFVIEVLHQGINIIRGIARAGTPKGCLEDAFLLPPEVL